MGVYHSIYPQRNRSSWIIIHPIHESLAYNRLKERLSNADKARSLLKEPLRQHVLLINEYLPNWEAHLHYYEKQIMKIVSY